MKSLLGQTVIAPANGAPDQFFETALSAMLRVIDTVRGTVDLSKKNPNRKVRLLGEPILLLQAKVGIEATAVNSPTDLAHSDPAPLAAASLPTVTIRIGDISRPDDGVLGCFDENGPNGPQFIPVSTSARDKAVLNGLSSGHGSMVQAVTHTFVSSTATNFSVVLNQMKDVTILADARSDIYATCGVLPRKKITMIPEFINGPLRQLEPTFRVGPIMTARRDGLLRAFVAQPDIEGYNAEFLYYQPAEGKVPDAFPESVLTPAPPLAELPDGRATLAGGWIRVFQAK